MIRYYISKEFVTTREEIRDIPSAHEIVETPRGFYYTISSIEEFNFTDAKPAERVIDMSSPRREYDG